MKKNILTIIIIFLMVFSWLGTIDKYSDDYTSRAIVEAGTSYAIARGINAVVSMLQTSTVEGSVVILHGSITIGEILDPINDLIERFSQVMTMVLGSLMLQKILLYIASNKIFSLLISVFGCLSIFLLRTRYNKMIEASLKLFLILLVVRFSLGMVLVLNNAVEHLFLSGQIQASSEQLENFKGEMQSLQKESPVLAKEYAVLKEKISSNGILIDKIKKNDVPELNKRLADINKKLSEARVKGSSATQKTSWANIFSSTELSKAVGVEYQLEQERKNIKDQIRQKETLVKALLEDIDLSESKITGSDEGILSKLRNIKNNLTLDSVGEKISGVVDTIVRLLTLFILKTILVPLLFLYVFLNLLKRVLQMNLADTINSLGCKQQPENN